MVAGKEGCFFNVYSLLEPQDGTSELTAVADNLDSFRRDADELNSSLFGLSNESPEVDGTA